MNPLIYIYIYPKWSRLILINHWNVAMYSNVIGTTHQIDGWNATHKNGDEWGWFMALLYQHYWKYTLNGDDPDPVQIG